MLILANMMYNGNSFSGELINKQNAMSLLINSPPQNAIKTCKRTYNQFACKIR